MSDGNNIQTTMTLDQQQFLREMAKQVNSIAKSARAFVEMKQAAAQAGQSSKQSFDLSLPSIRDLSTSIVGFGTLTQGVMAGVQKAVQLTIAEYQKLKAAQAATLEAIPEPAALQRQLAFNLTPDERQKMGPMLARIQKQTGARLQEIMPVLSDASSARGQLGTKEIESATVAALKLAGPHPMNTPTARELASRTLDLLDIHKQQTGELLTPEAMLGVISGLQIGARPVSIQQTAMSGLPAIAAMARQGQDIQSSAAFWASLTQLVKDPHGERERQSTIDLASELMTFAVEKPTDHVQRLNAMFEDALAATDFPGTRDEKARLKLRNKLSDQKLRDPRKFSEVAAAILRDDATSSFHGNSENRARLIERAADLQKAGRHQRTEDEFGNILDVPIEQIESVRAIKSPLERLEAISQLPELREAFAARAEHFGATVAKSEIKAFVRGQKEVWSQYRGTKEIVPTPSPALAKNMRGEVASLDEMPLQQMAQGLQEIESNVQRQKLAQTYNQRKAIAQKEVDQVIAQSHLGYVIDDLIRKQAPRAVDWMSGGMFASPEQLEINIASKALERVEAFLQAETNGSKRADWEADRAAFQSLIQRLKARQAAFDKPFEPKKAPEQKPDRVPGDPVGKLITSPIKQRLRPDIDFLTADLGDDVARRMALAQQRREEDFLSEGHDYDRLVRERQEDDEFRRQWADEHDAKLLREHERLKAIEAEKIGVQADSVLEAPIESPQRTPLISKEALTSDHRALIAKIGSNQTALQRIPAQRAAAGERTALWGVLRWKADSKKQAAVESEATRLQDEQAALLAEAEQQGISGQAHKAVMSSAMEDDGRHQQLVRRERIQSENAARPLVRQTEGPNLKPVKAAEEKSLRSELDDANAVIARHQAGVFDPRNWFGESRESAIKRRAATKQKLAPWDAAAGVAKQLVAAGGDESFNLSKMTFPEAVSARPSIEETNRLAMAAELERAKRDHAPPGPVPAAEALKPGRPLVLLPEGETLPIEPQPLLDSDERIPGIVPLKKKPVERKPFVPSDPERFAKAWRAVETSKRPRESKPMAERKPFVPSDPERFAKAQAAMERERSRRQINSPEHREGLDQPLLSAFQGNLAPETVSAGPSINIQGGDNKPVVGEIKNTNDLLQQLLGKFDRLAGSLQASQDQTPKSRGGREQTSKRPAAALAQR